VTDRLFGVSTRLFLTLECGSAKRLPLVPPTSKIEPPLAAMPMQYVATGQLRICIVS
jgi:hypothetical protein